MESKKKKQHKAIHSLKQALAQYSKNQSDLNFLTVVKAFEILVEYGWRELKQMVEKEGLEAPSPKMAIKEAARLGFISDPEVWLNSLEARNSSVHDYFGISEKEYLELAKKFLSQTEKTNWSS
ncbi:MAG: hypothetical protein A3G32_06720 [Deltaproteobacteria bacterium RIFCSPLOWO2_12_FULL_40_28]|nr:MAG: hypothetical protein A3C45_06765 [Deltaproteobacteria bacterium RIFCSPHIGHO2_02_FULL_40_28]OGQ19348.1 MAG: hypothetical protein A3E27_05050 [Deltaproteobacteria bacterium RIFCSPHIGHO2_12_FULL_40_32]OGQ40428.1 MAG: hypothetical protein A3I69_00020 [Deltaproteobacteria bacterium RIFCSPLOWO2_02_FULL_40_36]OGQ53664.1 MAG: hypothetical protein A3G32_06720 [Deltaproteobacteria bacterium RIFCSPLOWO2_12_FULL_40_28]